MTAARFFHLAILGGYDTGSEWANEQWQFGFSCVANTDGSLPSRDVIKAPCPTADVEPSSYSNTATGYNWTFGFAGTTGNPFSTQLQQGMGTAFSTYFTALKPYIAADMRMEGVKFTAFERDASGKPKVINGSTFGFLTTPVYGSAAAFRMPPQCAVVVSAQSGGRGPGGRGRTYVPCTGATLTVDGTVGSTEAQAMLTATNVLGQSLAANQKILLAVVNRNQFTYSGISQWRVGNHVDIQRRRVNAVRETYDSVNALF